MNEKTNGALEVEVKTLSKRFSEKRGLAQLHMYKPSKLRIKRMFNIDFKVVWE